MTKPVRRRMTTAKKTGLALLAITAVVTATLLVRRSDRAAREHAQSQSNVKRPIVGIWQVGDVHRYDLEL